MSDNEAPEEVSFSFAKEDILDKIVDKKIKKKKKGKKRKRKIFEDEESSGDGSFLSTNVLAKLAEIEEQKKIEKEKEELEDEIEKPPMKKKKKQKLTKIDHGITVKVLKEIDTKNQRPVRVVNKKKKSKKQKKNKKNDEDLQHFQTHPFYNANVRRTPYKSKNKKTYIINEAKNGTFY
eukprot:TRINITY_DN63_c0_g1_i1.p1 TRINITY_DN63_c0_g1~~TRINITY_DN63_c0_g1_i1.p1  ORF type:complete len:187 (+),score=50.69 TRINITY_DN63_c0_g1_i1:30-563(+)